MKRNFLRVSAIILLLSFFLCGCDIDTTTYVTPTATISQSVSATPTADITKTQTEEPTQAPTEKPPKEPTAKPTEKPTPKPTEKPTEKPTAKPTAKPSGILCIVNAKNSILFVSLFLVIFPYTLFIINKNS